MKKSALTSILALSIFLSLQGKIEASSKKGEIPNRDDQRDGQKKTLWQRQKVHAQQAEKRPQPDMKKAQEGLTEYLSELERVADNLIAKTLQSSKTREEDRHNSGCEEAAGDERNTVLGRRGVHSSEDEFDEESQSQIKIRERGVYYSSDEDREVALFPFSEEVSVAQFVGGPPIVVKERPVGISDKEELRFDRNQLKSPQPSPRASQESRSQEIDPVGSGEDKKHTPPSVKRGSEEHSKEADTFDSLIQRTAFDPLPEMESVDTLKDDIAHWIPSKSWWETLVSITPERQEAFERLALEKEYIAAQDELEKGLRLKTSRGKEALEEILDEAKPQLLAQIKKRRIAVRKQIRIAREMELITELEAAQAKQKLENEEKREDDLIKAAEKQHQSPSWWWRLLGYKLLEKVNQENEGGEEAQHVVDENDFVILCPEHKSPSPISGEEAQKDLKKGTTVNNRPTKREEHEQEDTSPHGQVSVYLQNKTPLAKWETSAATWFLKSGAGRNFEMLAENSLFAQESFGQSPLQVVDHIKVFTVDEIHKLFREQIKDLVSTRVCGAFWSEPIWGFLVDHKEKLGAVISADQIHELEEDRLYFSPVEMSLINQTPGHLWRDDKWFWLMKNAHVMFNLKERGQKLGAELIGPLYESRSVPEEIPTLLLNEISPKTWENSTWSWFEAHGKGRLFGTIQVTEDLYNDLCAKRNE